MKNKFMAALGVCSLAMSFGLGNGSAGAAETDAANRIDFSRLQHRVTAADSKAPVVYFTSDISPEGIMKAYEALGRTPSGKVAVKLSTGEAGNNHYLQPALIKDLVQQVNGTIVECNTAYGGSRASTAAHLRTAKDHGFTAIADVDIMDADGEMEIPIPHGKHLQSDLVGQNLKNYDFMVVLNHFKGHAMGGFGGALKNISIGVASSEGKSRIHCAASYSTHNMSRHDTFIEAMADAAYGVSEYFDHGQKMLYISVMNNLSVDCDCDSHPAEPDMHDIGILASLDPVALDQACVDLIYAAPDGKSVVQRIESRNGTLILDAAEALGLGQKQYQLQILDQQ